MKDELLIRYLNNELMPEEKSSVEEWINSTQENRSYFNKIKYIWDNSKVDSSRVRINTDTAWESIRSAAMARNKPVRLYPSATFRIISRIAAVAIILLAVGITGVYLTKSHRAAGIQRLSVRASNEIKEVTLPDGTRVWLNRHSSVTWPDGFKGRMREVTLTGEGYFEVEKNRFRPFIITAGDAGVRVLGTSFNVLSDTAISKTSVTVVTGKVALYDPMRKDRRVVLEPGDEGIMEARPPSISKQPNEDRNFLAWKTGVLKFENTPLDEVCETLTKHYGTFIRAEDDDHLKSLNLTATYDNKSLDEILEILAFTLDLSYATENDTCSLYSEQL